VHGAKAWVMEGVCGANTCVAQWLVCSTALPCCMVFNQSINVTPVAMKLKKLMPAIH
jgi:hypothetical protein